MILVLCNEPSRLAMATSSPYLQRAVEDAADAEAAEVVAVIQVGDQHLQDAVGIADGRRNVLHDGVEQRPQVGRTRLPSCVLAMPVLAMV